MKSDRRHELAHNVLDNELSRGFGFAKKHLNSILGVLIAALLVVAVVTYARNRSRQQHMELQQQLDDVMFSANQYSPDERIEQLRQLAGQDTDVYVAAMSNVQLGNILLLQRLYDPAPREQMQKDEQLSQAREHYQKVIDNYADQTVPVALAKMGLGRLAVVGGDYAEAKAQYDAVLKMEGLAGQPVLEQVKASLAELGRLQQPVPMASTAPATQPATAPAQGNLLDALESQAPAAPQPQPTTQP